MYLDTNKNARAVSVAHSWLTAVGIPFKKSSIDGFDIDVEKPSGLMMEVAIADSLGGIPFGGIIVSAEALSSSNKGVALNAFHEITNAAGYGKPIPIDRGIDPDHKLNFDDEFELIAMRHREFRLAPNPPPEVMKKYEPTINNIVRHYYNSPKNRPLLVRIGYTEGDLKTYALVWAINYIHKYTIMNDAGDENIKLLTNHIKQRFNEFFPLLWRKASEWFPAPSIITTGLYEGIPSKKHVESLDVGNSEARHDLVQPTRLVAKVGFRDNSTKSIEDYVTPSAKEAFLPTPHFSSNGYEDHSRAKMFYTDPRIEDKDDPEYTKQHNKLDKSSDAARKRSAANLLQEQLLTLPHDKRVKTLMWAVENASLAVDARKEAVRQIKKHRIDCSELACIKANSLLQKKEDVRIANASGV